MALPVKIASGFGVLEYWIIGVLEKSESPSFNLNESFHYSITPPLHHSSRLPQGGKTIEAPSGFSPKPGPSPNSGICDGPRFFTGENEPVAEGKDFQ
jgi:hypothetical protein